MPPLLSSATSRLGPLFLFYLGGKWCWPQGLNFDAVGSWHVSLSEEKALVTVQVYFVLSITIKSIDRLIQTIVRERSVDFK